MYDMAALPMPWRASPYDSGTAPFQYSRAMQFRLWNNLGCVATLRLALLQKAAATLRFGESNY